MADDVQPATVTTSDRCPECGAVDIGRRDTSPPAGTTQIWSCLRCGLVFYRYRRADDRAVSDERRRWLARPIGGGAPARPPWRSTGGRPADFVDELICFGADVLREAGATRERSRASREALTVRRTARFSPAGQVTALPLSA